MIITAVVLWIVSIIFIIITLKNIIVRSVKKRRCTEVTSGVISDVKEFMSRRHNYATREYTPTVSYTVDGKEYNKAYTKAYNSGAYMVGQTVEIMYNPRKPEEINKKGKSNKADVVMLVIGVAIGLIGVVLMIVG